MTENIEQISTNRIKIIVGLALTFFALQFFNLSFIVNWLGVHGVLHNLIRSIGYISFLSFPMFGLLYLNNLQALQAGDRAALYDDLTKHNELKAMELGCIVMFGLAGVLFVLIDLDFHDIINATAQDVARVVVMSGVVSVCLRFAYLEIRNA